MADPRLLIPATTELLTDWCGPVLVATTRGTSTDWSDGIVYGDRVLDAANPRDGNFASSWRALAEDYSDGGDTSLLTRYYRLDLGRDEAANRAAVCLARTLGHTPANGVTWVCEYYHRSLGWHLFPHRGSRDHRDLGMTPPSRPSHFGHRPRAVGWYLQVPELASLDAKDDTRFPGGARLVDRLALAIVTRHVFGGPRG